MPYSGTQTEVKCYQFTVSRTCGLPYENEQGPEYGDEWMLFYDDEGNTHTMNFSTLPQETRGMIFGDAYYYLYTRYLSYLLDRVIIIII